MFRPSDEGKEGGSPISFSLSLVIHYNTVNDHFQLIPSPSFLLILISCNYLRLLAFLFVFWKILRRPSFLYSYPIFHHCFLLSECFRTHLFFYLPVIFCSSLHSRWHSSPLYTSSLPTKFPSLSFFDPFFFPLLIFYPSFILASLIGYTKRRVEWSYRESDWGGK